MMRYHSFKLLAILVPTFSFAALVKRDLAPATNLPNGFSYYGCWTDSPSDRKLHSASYKDSAMTDESCVSFCSSAGYTYAGVEYSTECYCGFGLESSSTQQSDSACNMACGGSSSEPCGASNLLSVFTNGSAGGTIKQTANGYTYLGCYTDSPSSRGLQYVAHNDSTSPIMTIELCTSLCWNSGYKYAGAEYGGECFCDNTLGNSSNWVTGTPEDTGCDILCKGGSTEWCGGKGRLSLYSNASVLPSQQLSCPGFEGCSWSTSSATGGLSFTYPNNAALAHSGSSYASGGGATGSSGASSPRSVCIATYPYLGTGGAYRLSFYTGDVNNYRQDPRCGNPCTPPAYSLTAVATLAGQTYSVPLTPGSAYALSSYDLNIPAGYQTLQICANYNGIRRNAEDTLLLDDVSLYGPY